MTLQKDQPKPATTTLQKVVWAVTITIAGGCIIAAIILAIVNHVKLF